MCGIAGLVSNLQIEPARLSAMNDTLVHRGPDDHGVWISPDQRVGLAHRRLSIIDPSPLGHNPMQFGTDGSWITYNGEIYNFRELRQELQTHGFEFRSNSDTEVILAAYHKWGVNCLDRLIGMFAFALWDTSLQRLFVARDRLGQKPLYYSHRNGEFVFASELKALLPGQKFVREIDPEAVSMFLRYWYVPAPLSIFKNVCKLPPAHYALLDQGRLTTHRYWDPMAIAGEPHNALSPSSNSATLESLLRDAVRSQMISDVPLGAFLSGGIDSSLIVALMQEISPSRVKTFSIRFNEPEFNEADHASAVAKHLGTEHYEETAGVNLMLEAVELLADFFDEPFADPSSIPTYLLSRLTRNHVTVALTGDGGDELFFGYNRYHNYVRRSSNRRSHFAGIARALSAILPDSKEDEISDIEFEQYAHWHTSWSPAEIEAMTNRPLFPGQAHSEMARSLTGTPKFERAPLLDLVTYLPEDILTKVDRASMAASLEARAPLLDHRVVEFALRLPLEQKWNNGQGKQILREILYRKVPKQLLERPKMGFSVPLANWFRNGLREAITANFEGTVLEEVGVNPTKARTLWSQFLAGQPVSVDLIWSLFTLTAWASRWTASASYCSATNT